MFIIKYIRLINQQRRCIVEIKHKEKGDDMALIALLKKLHERINHWKDVSAQRRELRNMNDHLLKDIGLSHIDALREANRPFWDTESNFDSTLRINKKDKSLMPRHSSKRSTLRCCQDH